MATLTYRLKELKGDNLTIYARLKQGRQFDMQASIGLKCPKDRWSESKQEILMTTLVDFREINKKLKDFQNYALKEYEATKLQEKTVLFNNEWLKTKINLFFKNEFLKEEEKVEVYFTNHIERFIEESKSKKNRLGTPIKPRTIQHYNTTLTKTKAFEKEEGIKLRIIDIDLNFHCKFIEFLEKKQKLNPNTIGGYVDDVKLFINNADKKGITIRKEVKSSEFFSPKNKTKDIYLKEDEINSIFNYKFEVDYLDNARDWFIIGLRTGLRISDFLRLSDINLVDGFIEKTTLKTDFPVIIPIHEQVQFILDKREGAFPRQISDQKFNNYIKLVCKEVGMDEMIDGAKMDELIIKKGNKKEVVFRKKNDKFKKYELVSSHICRRSFATNLYGKIDTLTIMKITGHTTESQFLSYIKITPKEYAEKLKNYWKNRNLD